MTHQTHGTTVRVPTTVPDIAQKERGDLAKLLRQMVPISIVGLFVLGVLYTLYFAAELVLPVFCAYFLSVMLKPVVSAMSSAGLPKSVGAALILLSLVGTAGVAVTYAADPVQKWIQRAPSLQREIEQKLWPVKQSIEKAKAATEKIEAITDVKGKSTARREVTIKTPSLGERLLQTTWFTVVQILIALALTFFLLSRDEERSKRLVQRYILKDSDVKFDAMFSAVQRSVTRYLGVSALIYSGLGLLTTVAMVAFGMPNPLLWGILAAVMGFLPYVGPLVTFVCIAAVALLSFDNWWQIAAPPVTYGIITVIEGSFITPAVLGKKLMLSPIAIFLSMLFCTWVWGAVGALLAAPILAYITVVFRHLTGNTHRLDAEEAELDAEEAEAAA